LLVIEFAKDTYTTGFIWGLVFGGGIMLLLHWLFPVKTLCDHCKNKPFKRRD
jgi:hypothetical protein